MLDPPLLLLDEPMGALDPMVRARLQRDLKHIFAALEKTVILVTHSLDEAGHFERRGRHARWPGRSAARCTTSSSRWSTCSCASSSRLSVARGEMRQGSRREALRRRAAAPRGLGLRRPRARCPGRRSGAAAHRLEAIHRVHIHAEIASPRPRAPRGTSPSSTEEGLGGTAVVFRALEEGSIDLYPEYTGTFAEAVLHHHANCARSLDEPAWRPRPRGADSEQIPDPLPDNTYALAMLHAGLAEVSATLGDASRSRRRGPT